MHRSSVFSKARIDTAIDSLIHGRRGAHLVYVALAGLLGVSAWAAIRHGENRVVDLFAANLATEALGLVVTLVLVHRFLERQERALRLRGSLGAVRRAGRALALMVDVWTEMVKGGLERAPEPKPTELAELLAPDLVAALVHVDASRPEVAAAAERLAQARDALRTIIATYGSTLDPVYLGAIDDLTDDPFLAAIAGDAAAGMTHEERFRSVARARSARITHFERLLLAVDYHNLLARDAARLRDRRTAPRGDGYTPSLPLDVDLRVHVGVSTEWWSVAPRPGSLRVRFRDADVPEADGIAAAPELSGRANALSRNDVCDPAGAVRGFPLPVLTSVA